jgi:leader peptidase (prepilin peptidase)/N-methyltransferase
MSNVDGEHHREARITRIPVRVTLLRLPRMTPANVELPLWIWRVFAFLWGCLWGSFANVVIHRLPRGMSVAHPASHCPACGAYVRPYDNIPVLSWILLRGRARCCGARISPRYAVVELLGGGLSLAVAEMVIADARAGVSFGHCISVFLSDFALTMALVVAAFIDAAYMYLPDAITIGGTLFGLATPGLRELDYKGVLFGAAAGFVGVWLPLVVGYEKLRGRAGMGLGDAKLVMLAGAWYGWVGAAFALFAGAVQATVAVGLVLLARGRLDEPEAVRADRQLLQQAAAHGDEEAQRLMNEDPLATGPSDGLMAARLPFGPFLCLAIIEWMLASTWMHGRVAWTFGLP